MAGAVASLAEAVGSGMVGEADTLPAVAAVGIPVGAGVVVQNCWVAGAGIPVAAAEVYLEESSLILAFSLGTVVSKSRAISV